MQSVSPQAPDRAGGRAARPHPEARAAALPAHPFSWRNATFLLSAHALAAVAVWYMAAVRFSPATLGLALLWFALCGFSITGGYHRLFAHRSYKAGRLVRLFHALFGAASVQNSALRWAGDHRRHHAREAGPEDPYDIGRGFFWAHVGWIFFDDTHDEPRGVNDLAADPLLAFQHRHYLLLATVFGALVPMAIASLWGDPLGGLLVGGFLRLVVQWHATFAVNSFGHWTGSRPYSEKSTARDSFLVALITLGEGYHNFHHRFPADYRNGVRWHDVDPTKWAIWSLSRVGLVEGLKRTPPERIRGAREAVQRARLETAHATASSPD